MPRLLITCCNRDGALLLGDGEGEPFRALAEGNFRGMCAHNGLAYAITGEGALYEIDPETARCDQVAELPLGGCHDLRCLGDAFWIAASHDNTLARYDLQWQEAGKLQFFPSDEDCIHFNSLDGDGQNLYCSIFTFTPDTRRHKRLTSIWRKDGRILNVDWETGRFHPASQPLCQPHSVHLREGGLILCSSYRQEVVSVDLKDGAVRSLVKTPGWCRGLALVDEGRQWIVGLSVHRGRKLKFLHKEGRLAFYRADDWRLLRQITLPHPQVYEILPLPLQRQGEQRPSPQPA